MKNTCKALICALTLAAAIAAVPAVVSARDGQEVYMTDSANLILREQPNDFSPITFWLDGDGYVIHVQDYMNGFAFCYVPGFEVNGWIDLDDIYYLHDLDDEGFYYDDDYFYGETLHSWVDSGFLALRYAPAFDDSNIIAEIYQNGTVLQMTGEYAGNYGYCYVPAFDMYGWVDVRFTY